MKNESIQVSKKSKLLTYYEKYMLVVGVLGQLLFYIQGVKIVLTQSANDISITAFSLAFISVSSWLIYGILIKNRVLIFANAVAVVGALFVIVGTLIYRS